MRLSRLRSGERLALAGAVALAVLLGLDWWFLSAPEAIIGAHESGIRSVGWFAALLLIGAIACGLALGFFTLTQRATALPIVFSVLSLLFGLLATFTILLRLIFQPTLGVEAGAADVDVELAAFLGLFSAAAIAAGGWIATLDERTDSDEAIEQTEEALLARGDNPRKPPPATAAPRSGPADALADPANP